MRPSKWTESEIKRAFDNFIRCHARLPTKSEMYGKYKGKFPRPLSVKLTTGMTIKQYLVINYSEYLNLCQSRIYGHKTKEHWVDDFKRQYTEYNKPIESEYNKLRKLGTPNTETLAKIIGVKTWREVLDYCGFYDEQLTTLDVQIDFEETIENYTKLNNILQSFIIEQ